MSDGSEHLKVLIEIRNWIRAASHDSVRKLLHEALPDAKSRAAYQMMDGTFSMDQIRINCKMSPNALVALAKRCESMGLVEAREKKRVRLFDLNDFSLNDPHSTAKSGEK